MPTIRDTIDPLNERPVSDEEFLDLSRQNIVLTGTRAKTPEGLRAAAIRQVTELGRSTVAAPPPADEPVVDDQDDDDQDSGAPPVSTSDDTPTSTSNQER